MEPTETKAPKKKRKTLGRRKQNWRRYYNKHKNKYTPEELEAIGWYDPKKRMAWVRAKTAELPYEERTRTGVPDGMRKAQARKLQARARKKADYLMEKLQEEGVLHFEETSDEQMAKSALHEAFVQAMSPGDRDAKLRAIRTVLEYTKAKPATKTDLRLNNAEAWLQEVVADHKATNGEQP